MPTITIYACLPASLPFSSLCIARRRHHFQSLTHSSLHALLATHSGGWEGTAPESPAVDPSNGAQALSYEEDVKFHTAWLCILNPLKAPPAGFEQAVRAHFAKKRKLIVATLDSWVRKSTDTAFKARLRGKIDEILDELEKDLTLDDLRREFYEAVASMRYVRQKQADLSLHLDVIGEEPFGAKGEDNKLRKRLCKLVQEGEMLLRHQKSVLARARRRYFVRRDPAGSAAAVCPILTKPGYSLRPSLDELRAMTDAQLAALPSLEVVHAEHGSVKWDGPVDVRGLDLDEAVVIEPSDIQVYPSPIRKPARGKGLNRKAALTLLRYAVPEADKDNADDYLRSLAGMMGGRLVSFDATTGVLVLQVPNFAGVTLREASRQLAAAGAGDGGGEGGGSGDY